MKYLNLIMFMLLLISCGYEEVNPCESVKCNNFHYCNELTGTCDIVTGRCIQNSDCDIDDMCNTNNYCVSIEILCESVTCSNKGVCVVENYIPKCNCDDGYTEEGLNCIENYDYNFFLKQFGTSWRDEGNAVITDKEGNVCITGYAGQNFQNSGNKGVFLSKYNNQLEHQWTKQWGDATGRAIAVDNDGNIYITGSTDINFDGNINAGGDCGMLSCDDIFLTKFNSAGEKQWTKLWGNNQDDVGYSISIDLYGNIFIAGYSENDISDNDILLIKFNNSGNVLWYRILKTNDDDKAYGMAVDYRGDVFITGYTEANLDGNESSGGICWIEDCSDIFLTKYSNSGVKLWTKQWGTKSTHEEGKSVFADNYGNVVVASSGSEIFLTKFDNNGNKLWTKEKNNVTPTSTVIDNNGNIYVIGYTHIALDGNVYGGGCDEYSCPNDIFLIKYNSAGNNQWTKQWGTDYSDIASSVFIDDFDNLFITGYTGASFQENQYYGDLDIFLMMLKKQ